MKSASVFVSIIACLLFGSALFADETAPPAEEPPAADEPAEESPAADEPTEEPPAADEPVAESVAEAPSDPRDVWAQRALAEGPVIDGALKIFDVDPKIREKMKKVAACYRGRLKKNPELSGACVLQIRIEPDGRIDNIETVYSDTGDAKLERCIRGKLKVITFKKPSDGQPASVYYPFRFKPSV